jgi:hypothetical protein
LRKTTPHHRPIEAIRELQEVVSLARSPGVPTSFEFFGAELDSTVSIVDADDELGVVESNLSSTVFRHGVFARDVCGPFGDHGHRRRVRVSGEVHGRTEDGNISGSRLGESHLERFAVSGSSSRWRSSGTEAMFSVFLEAPFSGSGFLRGSRVCGFVALRSRIGSSSELRGGNAIGFLVEVPVRGSRSQRHSWCAGS